MSKIWPQPLLQPSKVTKGENISSDGDRRSMNLLLPNGLAKEFPLGVATVLANVFHFIWRVLALKSQPPLPPLALRLMAREFSVSDAKARKELGYQNVISFEEGIEELKNDLLSKL